MPVEDVNQQEREMANPQANEEQRLDPNNPKHALQILFNAASIPALDMKTNTVIRVAHVTLHTHLNPVAVPEPVEDGPEFGEEDSPGLGDDSPEDCPEEEAEQETTDHVQN